MRPVFNVLPLTAVVLGCRVASCALVFAPLRAWNPFHGVFLGGGFYCLYGANMGGCSISSSGSAVAVLPMSRWAVVRWCSVRFPVLYMDDTG